MKRLLPEKMARKMAGLLGATGLCLLLNAPLAEAFMLNSTRVILPEGEAASVTVISGSNDNTLLIRTRVSSDRKVQTPVRGLIISPPLFRLEKGGRGNIRFQGTALPGMPADRESVLYLSVSGLPPSGPLRSGYSGVSGGVVVALGIQVKLFYRPVSLKERVAEPWKSLTASRVPGGVKVSNPTPFYLTFSRLEIEGRQVKFDEKSAQMLPPFSSQVYGSSSVTKKNLNWMAVNDLGGVERGTTVVQ